MLATFEVATDFVPQQLDATKWDQLEPLYQALIDRKLNCSKCLQRLIVDRSELDAATNEALSMLYIGMTCHTDDAQVKAAYLDFIENVLPQLKTASFELDKRVALSPFAKDLDPARFGVLLRDTRAAVELFRPENVPIETELTKLEQQYSELCGSMTVTFRGEEKTLPQMARYQEEPDRKTREEAWRTVAERRFRDRERIDSLFEQMLALRQKVARNAGFANYRDYAFKARRRFDYTAEDCHNYARGCEQHVVPALRRLNEQRRKSLGVDTLRPWDMGVDVKGRPPLRPFKNGADLVDRTTRVFRRMDPSPGGLGEMFVDLCSNPGGMQCLDLETRKGKAPGGYQSMRDRTRLPFIFMNAAGLQRDVETMVHEAGHAFHSLLCRADPILFNRSEIPLEFCEVASMSMELTSHPYLEEYYGNKTDADRARRVHLEQLSTMLPWIATIDQFQHWVYTNEGHTREQRHAYWKQLMARFGAATDWSGIEDMLGVVWHRQMHLFGSPFYYIEYGIAQLGALQLYANYRKDAGKAIAEYKRGLALGGAKPLRELFAGAGLVFDFSPERIAQTWSEVEKVLATLPE